MVSINRQKLTGKQNAEHGQTTENGGDVGMVRCVECVDRCPGGKIDRGDASHG